MSKIIREIKVDAYEGEDIAWSVLNGVCELVVEQTDVAKVDFEEVELQQDISSKFISEIQRKSAITRLFCQSFCSPIDELFSNPESIQEI